MPDARGVLLAMAMALAAVPVPALAQHGVRESYACVTADFVTSSAEADFIAGNLAKTFDIRIEGDQITVHTRSDRFADTTHRYQIALRDMLGTIAFRENRLEDRMILPFRRAETYLREGRLPISISLQGAQFVNTWLLSCHPA